MTLKEQLLREIEQAPEALLEDLLSLCWATRAKQQRQPDLTDPLTAERGVAQQAAVQRLQAKMRETIAPQRSLVDELIAERRIEALNE